MNNSAITRGLVFGALFGRKDFVSLSDPELAFSDIVLVLLTASGSRPFRRDFGSSLMEELFNPFFPGREVDLTNRIREAVVRFVPRVMLDKVRASFDAKSKTVSLHIDFRMRSSQTERITRTVTMSKGLFDGNNTIILGRRS